MTLVLLEKGLLLEGSTPKIEDKQVPGVWLPGVDHFPSIFNRTEAPKHLPKPLGNSASAHCYAAADRSPTCDHGFPQFFFVFFGCEIKNRGSTWMS